MYTEDLQDLDIAILAKKRLRSSRSAKHRSARSAKMEKQVYLGLQLQLPCAGFEPAFLFYMSL